MNKMIGLDIHNLASELWPLNRSITGEGTRETLRIISKHIPNLCIKSVPSGTNVFDWKIPKEWYVKEAYIITPNGEKICDFSKNNLHLLGYSISFKGEISLKKLKNHLYTLPEIPDAIPYITSYYEERWGFCLSHNQFESLKEGNYIVHIDTKKFNGVLNYGELLVKGNRKEEIFLSTFICHPSMANDQLSGPTVLTYLVKWIMQLKNPEYSYRIVFIPETIGSITYLSLHYKEMKNKVIAGFCISCIGDERSFSYVPSRNGETMSDVVAKHVLYWTDHNYKSYTWLDRGSDERQYCAPGIDLPVASIMRSRYTHFREYHTSLDDLKNVVTPKGLDGGYWVLRRAIEAIERNKKYKVTVLCEPQMSKRGLYPTLSTKTSVQTVKLMMNFISLSDGKTSLIEIANKLNMPIWKLYDLVDKLESHDLITAYE